MTNVADSQRVTERATAAMASESLAAAQAALERAWRYWQRLGFPRGPAEHRLIQLGMLVSERRQVARP